MTLTVEQLNNNTNAAVAGLPGVIAKIQKDLAIGAVQLIRDRLVQGKTAQGKSLGTYSDKPISPLFFIGKGLGSGADAAVKDYAKKHPEGISYKTFRELNGRPTNHVTLSFTGETLADIGVTKTTQDDKSVVTTVASFDRKTKDIVNAKGKKTGEITTGEVLEQLNKKYGNALDTELLELSKEEEAQITKAFDYDIQKYLDQYFG